MATEEVRTNVGNFSWFRHGVRSRSPGTDLDRKQSAPVNQTAAKKFEIEDETYNKVKKAIKEKEIKNEE